MEEKGELFTVNKAKAAVYKIPGIRTVVVYVYIKGGSWYEEGGGGCHLIEHLLFQGTENLPTWEKMEDYQQKYGISVNASTSPEKISVWFKFPDIYFKEGIFVVEEMLFKSRLNPKERDKMLGVITQEYKNKWDSPYNRFHREKLKQMFGADSPAVKDGMGDINRVKNLTDKEISELYQKIFQPQNMVFAVAGNVKPGEVKEKIKKMLGRYKNGQVLKAPKIRLDIKNKIMIYRDKVEQNTILINFGANKLDVSQDGLMTLHLGNYLLGPSSKSLMYQKLRQEQGLAYSFNSFYWNYAEQVAGVEMWANTDRGNIDKVRQAIKEIVDNFLKNLKEEEVKKVTEFLNINTLMNYDSPYSVAESMAGGLFYDGVIFSPQERIKMAKKLNVKKVRDYFKQFFRWDNAVISILSGEEG